ncbi:bromodomain-containing protein 8-like [Phalacrocorax carbo]|uniref:bromodomain-containing protein 8-like n=1 Tax=Phalacrocorax carbo TaxID=9209 RepID=UPI003119A36E
MSGNGSGSSGSGYKEIAVSFYVCLQMGRAWVWWEPEMESPSESENSDLQSLLSWDSSLDLDMGSWRNTEEVAMGKLEESSREADCEFSEPLWGDDSEDYQMAERPCEDDSLLQFFSEVTQMMEPLHISSTESSQAQWNYCGSGKRGDGEDVRCQEKTTGTAVSGADKSQLHVLADKEDHFPGREDKTQETPGEQALGEPHPREMSNQAQDQDNSDSASAAHMLDSTNPANMQMVQLSWDNPLQHLLFKRTLLSIWKMIASHRYSGPFLKAVSEKQAPGYRDVVKRPMDLTSIKRRLSKGHIQSMVQFQHDLMLMFQNAVMYNSFNHHVHRMAMEMQQEVLEQLQMLGEALLCSRDRLGWGRR